jgi:hypothetical protein
MRWSALIAKPLLALVLAATALPATAAAQAPPGPPGPPPGNGTDLPASPGTAQPFVPPGAVAAIPDTSGPGLLTGDAVALNRARRSFSLQLACQGNGSIKVRAKRVAAGDVATARYRCTQGRATARFTTTRKIAKRVTSRRTAAATAIVSQAGKPSRLYFNLTAGKTSAQNKGFWTDGHLDCTQGYLVEPDFTTKSPIPISTRGWVAWYTPAAGWHWLGNIGEDAGRWNAWTASVSGVTQFHPDGAVIPVPWTMGPIAVPAGRGIYAVGVYEIVYWVGGRAEHQWQYVNAGTTGAVAAGAPNQYCVYP